MTGLPKASDAEIERVIETMIPELRKALKQVMQDHRGADCFDCAIGTNSKTGIKTRYFCFIAEEDIGLILEGTMNGVGRMMDRNLEILRQVQKAS